MMYDTRDTSNRPKYWIHKFNKNLLKQLNALKTLGAEKKRSMVLKNITVKDKIILFSTLNVDNQPKICFIAYTMVKETFRSNEILYDHYSNPKKLKLMGLKYFNDPLVARDMKDDLDFIKNKKGPSGYFKSEYKEVSEKDFKTIIQRANLTKDYPAYLENVSFTLEDFLLNSIDGLYKVIRKTEKTRNQIEIKLFIKLLKKLLKGYGISKSYDEIEEFYAKNVWKLGFKHKASRDPDKFVALYNRLGKKTNFSYISLE